MTRPVVLLNDHKRIEQVYTESEQYLTDHPNLREEAAVHLWAYQEAGDLIPQTVEKFGSGHFFPYSESYCDLESSLELCMQGFYKHAYFALRCVLELGTLGLYFDKDDAAETDVHQWLISQQDTPWFRNDCLSGLFGLQYFRRFDEQFSLRGEIEAVWDWLNDHAHTRGYYFSGRAAARSNVNRFNEASLSRYTDCMKKVVRQVITMMLLKYPVGMQALPLDQKFGINPPAGGFLDESAHRAVLAVIDEEARQVLKAISDSDPDAVLMAQHILSMPDLDEEELRRQLDQLSEDWPDMPEG